MGYRKVLALAGGLLAVGLSSSACGGGRANPAPASADAGGAGEGNDASPASTDASGEASIAVDGAPGEDGPLAPSCGTVPPSGRQIVASPTASIVGVTTDGYAIYADTSTSTLYALAIDPDAGVPVALGKLAPGGPPVVVSGRVVLFAAPAEAGAAIGDLAVWSAANGSGPSLLSTSAYVPTSGGWFATVSPDGSHIVYLDGASATSATLTVATTDGNLKKALIPGVDLTRADCRPQGLFAGLNVVASYCPAGVPDDGGTAMAATLTAFVDANFDPAPLASGVDPAFVVDGAGGQVLVATGGGLVVYPTTGGVPTTIDPAGTGGLFTQDGSDVIYTTRSGALGRLRIAAPPPTVLATRGLTRILALSPDENWILARNAATNLSTDLYLASATKPGTPAALSASPAAALYGDPFTRDSRYALFFTNVANGTGDFYVASTAGGAPTRVTSNAWMQYATSGSKGVVNDDYNANGGGSGNGIADIESFDATNPSGLATLVTAADANFYPTAARDQIVYSWTCAPLASAGVWVLRAP